MKKEELLIKVSEEAGVKSAVAKRVIKALIKTVGRTIQNGDKVTLTGMGTFRIKKRKPKPARNLQTGETVQLPEGKKISFKPSLSFKQLLKNKEEPETIRNA